MKLLGFEITRRKSMVSPTPEELEILTGVAFAGLGISSATALTVPAVQSCILLLSEACASLEIRVEKKGENGWEKDKTHPVAILLADQPNEFSSTYELIRDLIATALTNDVGALAWVNKVDGEVREITRYMPGYYQVDYSGDGRNEPSFRVNNRPRNAEDVIFIKSHLPRSPLSMAADAIAAAKSMETHARKLWENGARPSGVLESPKAIGDEATKKMGKAFRDNFAGADSSGKIPLLWDGMTFRPLTLNSTDSQFLENRKYQVLEVCRSFRVPPSMIYELDRATWSNGEQQGKEFLTYSLESWLQLLETSFRRALFNADERKTYRVKIDRDDLTRADFATRATAVSSLVSAKMLNPNEGREWFDLPPYQGGEEYGNPHINPEAGSSQPGDADQNIGGDVPNNVLDAGKEPTNDA